MVQVLQEASRSEFADISIVPGHGPGVALRDIICRIATASCICTASGKDCDGLGSRRPIVVGRGIQMRSMRLGMDLISQIIIVPGPLPGLALMLSTSSSKFRDHRIAWPD
jgi:hypothetical protein